MRDGLFGGELIDPAAELGNVLFQLRLFLVGFGEALYLAIELLLEGNTQAEIAAELGVGQATISRRLNEIREKLPCN